MKLIDNINRLLDDDLKQALKPGARLKVAASRFSMCCTEWAPAIRIAALSTVLKQFDRVGLPRVLRSVSDAADRDIAEGRGLRNW